jgi:hypothetical protein
MDKDGLGPCPVKFFPGLKKRRSVAKDLGVKRKTYLPI